MTTFLFRQLFDATSSTYTYLMADDYGASAILIDPVKEHIDTYLQVLKELNLTLLFCFDTHVHADHITAAGLLRQETGCDIIMGEHAKTPVADRFLKDGEYLGIGNLRFKALYTPGHTDDCYCLALPDRVFTGDTLLIRGTGRTDLQNGDAKAAYRSITEKLFTLPDHTLVYPAHDYKGWTVSSIVEEKKYNPRLQVHNADEYAVLMGNLHLPQPNLIDIAIPANLRCGLEK